ncbi:MAG: prolyl oligopeptidase family serine peptidase [Rubrivivax sp.]|nr:prolyl oligopeptidase family serine peptidase [Rubrivivax sp.]
MSLVLSRRAALALVGALPLASRAQPAAAPALPVAAVRNVSETFFGTVVNDPYRYFEDTKNAEVAAWMKAHSEHTHRLLKGISGRSALREQLERLDASASARVIRVRRVPTAQGELFFYETRSPKDDQFKLVVRQGLQGSERVLFDPETLRAKTGKPHAINYFSPSPDGRLVALGVSASGSEEASLRVLQVASGRQIGPEISRAQFGALSWAPDSSQLFFHRMQALKKGMPETDKYQRSTAVVMKPGAGEAGLRVLLRAGDSAARNGGVNVPVTEFPFVDVQPDGRAIAYVYDGVSPEFRAYHSTLAKIRAGRPAWQRLFDKDEGVTSLAVAGARAYVLTHQGAPRYKLLGGALEGFALARAELLVPEAERVLTGIAAAKDALYLEAREGNVERLYRVAHRSGAQPEAVTLAVVGSVSLGAFEAQQDGGLLELESWNRARQIYALGADGRLANTGLQPAGPFDAPADVVATEVLVKSHDGAMVPMSIIHRAGTPLDGRNPTILYGYASYGITEEPFFSLSRLAWMERGGVFAVANPRGSSVFGKQWHTDGQKARKPNTWRDFIACAEHLVKQGWTQPSRLAIWGGSAGGILVGMAMVERPDLFGVVIPEVGSLDLVRAETTPNGVPNIPEFGTRTIEAEFRGLLAMSTYHQIKDGTAYPAVMFTHGVNDPRVEVWNTTKTAARVMAATTSGKPVLVRLDYEAGHGIGNTKSQALDERADLFAFLLWQMGLPGWAPQG